MPLVKLSSIQGKGSSSRTEAGSSLMQDSEAKKVLAAVHRFSISQASADAPQPTFISPPANKENLPRCADVVTRRLDRDSTVKRPLSVTTFQALDPASGLHLSGGMQMKPSTESIDSQAGYAFTSPLYHDMSKQLMSEPPNQSTYSEPEYNMFSHCPEADLHTAPASRASSRRGSVPHLEIPRSLSASVPSLLPYPPPLPYDENISIALSNRNTFSQLASRSIAIVGSSRPSSVAHPSAIMPIALSLSNNKLHVSSAPERSILEPMSRDSSGYSYQSWVTEPVQYTPWAPPIPTFQQPTEITPSPPSSMQCQQQMLAGTADWTTETHLAGSALLSDPFYLSPPASAHGKLGSMDERLKYPDPGWSPEIEPVQVLNFGGHHIDVRDARLRLNESTHMLPPLPQLDHPNLSGPVIQHDGQVYVSDHEPRLEVCGTRPRSGSSPVRPNYVDLGMRFL
ncbi:NB-ARC [Penicillium digitatum]|nr:NB-ARC [Penicillium digitatum]